jgi:exodeoxyribonuclease VII small subunit
VAARRDARKRKDEAPRPDSPADADDLSFEAALERLESIVAQLEDGEMELEAALAAFEQGVALSRRCADQLQQAKRRIEVLVGSGEPWETRPLPESQESE